MASAVGSSLDVDWLLHSKKGQPQTLAEANSKKEEPRSQTPQIKSTEPTPPSTPTDHKPLKEAQKEGSSAVTPQKPASTPNGTKNPPQAIAQKNGATQPQLKSQQVARPSLTKGQGTEDKKGLKSNTPNGRKDGRRSSWISSISSKFSSSNSPVPSRQANADDRQALNKAGVPSPQPSPKLEVPNPFSKKEQSKEGQPDPTKEEKPSPPVHVGPRRPSVLVAAGKETKLDHPGFLSSALRRLSSSSNANMGKGAASTGAICPRRVLNIDQNRERIKFSEFDQNKLKRVAFCVDVEIAGYSASADEKPDEIGRPAVSNSQKQSTATEKQSIGKKDVKDAKIKDKGEGAALKNPTVATEAKEESQQSKPEPPAQAQESEEKKEVKAALEEAPTADSQSAPTTRKKEKKKRSEAERKERKERKRKHAEANGLVPLELTREDSDSDSNSSNTPPGATTPKRPVDGPTTDPLRIYKRCCQLRETSVLNRMKEQIAKPSATLAEAPGTVAVVDLSGSHMQLQDINTLGDWLAIVPVRKLILEDCGLTDEGIRVILSGLSSCKSAEQARQNRRLPKRPSGKHGIEQMGVIEKLCLKNNPGITNLGWKHIGLFMHMSRSLRAIDLSGIRFPRSGDLSRSLSTTSSISNSDSHSKYSDLGALILHALSERMGDRFEELILSGCGLSTANVRDIVECAMKCKIRRLGLADNNLDEEALNHLVRYIKSGCCEGLDLGGNDLQGMGHILAEVADDKCPLFAISLSGCNLTPSDLNAILVPFAKLTNLKFMDLSRNKALFNHEPNAVPILRKLLPRLTELKRIHLADVGLTPDQVIALSEILPDCPNIIHVSILDNAPLLYAMNSKEEGAQEEACAFFAALMTAVRVSETISAIEIEVPGTNSSEVVKALASQVVAYSLRNMERTTLGEIGVQAVNPKYAPEVLLHLVGHMDGYAENHDNDEPGPDEDYLIASTGIVKALDVCLGSKDGTSRVHSRNISPSVSGTATPRHGASQHVKPRDVSLQLCDSARKIRTRLRPVLVREDRAGNDYNYRRLFNLDQTLQRMIQRFEDEYPETKTDTTSSSANEMYSPDPSIGDPSLLSTSVGSDGLMKMTSAEEYFPGDSERRESYAIKLSRTASETSLAARAFTDEEGRMHRLGQSIRREVLKPTGMDDNLHGTSTDDDPEAPHLAALRAKFEQLRGEDIRAKVERDGADSVLTELGLNAQELLALRKTDPEGFETFRKSQLAAQINSGRIDG
ncbi:Microtubules assembly and stabilization protein [Exophiala xenobiotica]|nr:Microtubules assembly and stabilization protein [Exophiala xenobiotica]KAK5394866.1 Microtubules assembly and stabilization protein [Exophiala xenobiotica]KAK5413134.1 Microtubules assembly and stabilization protein [Exophiala xenobiotica]KAK5461768.1 Microtubules assembly and stabilization protein [Exophiala xenobiotica]KAK5482452.1 Microtubules assembly and stabilization protein [Exophiala xenobiotica]